MRIEGDILEIDAALSLKSLDENYKPKEPDKYIIHPIDGELYIRNYKGEDTKISSDIQESEGFYIFGSSKEGKSSFVFNIKEGGSLSLQDPKSQVLKGVKRGVGAIDFQTKRSKEDQIASGPRSFIGNGIGNKVAGVLSTILNGIFNVIDSNSRNSVIIGGFLNYITGSKNTVILGGSSANSFGRDNIILQACGSNYEVGDSQLVVGVYSNNTVDKKESVLNTDRGKIFNKSNTYSLQKNQWAKINYEVFGTSKKNYIFTEIEAIVRNNGYKIIIEYKKVLKQIDNFIINKPKIILACKNDSVYIKVRGVHKQEINWITRLKSIEIIN